MQDHIQKENHPNKQKGCTNGKELKPRRKLIMWTIESSYKLNTQHDNIKAIKFVTDKITN